MVIRRVGVLSVGKVFGALYCVFGLLAGLVIALISVLGVAVANQQPGAAKLPPAILGVGAIVIFPLIYGVAGFIVGLIGAAFYNVAAGIVGGIELDLGE
jgi:hypothetical protein